VITEQLADGTTAILTAQGWRRARPDEQAALETSHGQAWAAQPVRQLRSLLNTLLPMGGAARGNFTEFGADQQADQVAQARLFEPLDRAQPGATAAGQFYGDPLNVAAGAVGVARLGRGLMAQRVLTKATSQARATGGSVGAAAVGDDAIGRAAAAEKTFIKRLVGAPRQLYDDVSRAADEFLSPGELTMDQRAMLPAADRLGFKFMPGQREGAAGLRIMAESDPLIQSAFAGDLAANRQGLRAAAARAIGVNADDFSRNFLGQAADDLGSVFDDIGRQIGDVQIADDLLQRIDNVRATEPFLAIPEGGRLSGGQLMQLRSSMDAASRQAWLAGANTNAGKAQYIDDIVNELDDLAQAALAPDQRELWRVARQRWRNLKVLESPNVVNPSGEINARSLDTRLKKYYKGEYGRQVTGEGGRRANLLPETQEFMDWARLGNQFADNFPNSGTPYRNRLIQLMTDPKELAKSMVLRSLIEQRLASSPTP